MRANEIFGQMKWFRCRVRVVLDGFSSVVNTLMTADTRSGVIAILSELYGRKNVLSCNEISGVLSEKSYGAPNMKTLHHDTMSRRPYSSEQLQVKAVEKKARDAKASGDTALAAQAKAQVAVTKAQQKKNKAQQDYTRKAMKLSSLRGA